MTDELLYERFAISIAGSVSDVGHIYGAATSTFSQLYPAAIAPTFIGASVPADLHAAHLVNAWLMSSACVPAYVLARRILENSFLAAFAGALVVCVPWMFYASFLLTEVLAYPMFLWACVAIHRAVSTPSARNDGVAILVVVAAFFARTQFVLLAAVLPLAVVIFELRRKDPDSRDAQPLIGMARGIVARHRLLAACTALAIAVSAVMAAEGRLHDVLGSYGGTARAGVPHGFVQGLFEHVSTLALGVGVLPMIAAAGWVVPRAWRADNDDQRAFASVASIAFLAVVVVATMFDLRLGAGQIVYDRYLFYVVPLVLLAAVATFEAAPAWPAVLGAGAAIAVGFAVNVPPAFEWKQFETLSPDAPITALYRPLVAHLHGVGAVRLLLVAGTIALCLVTAATSRLGGRAEVLRLLLTGLTLLLVPLNTMYVIQRLFEAPGWSGRPVTIDRGSTEALAWLDHFVGSRTDVTVIPYSVSSDYLVNLKYWRDLEFWNKTVGRVGYYGDPRAFSYTGTGFPRFPIRIDRGDGTISSSPTPLVAQSVIETRFRISGEVVKQTQELELVKAGSSWRAAWITFGATDDGWIRSSRTAKIRVFSTAHQHVPRILRLTIQVVAPPDVERRTFRVASNEEVRSGVASGNDSTFVASLPVCVPPNGHADVDVRGFGDSKIPGDLRTYAASLEERRASIHLSDISVSDDIGPRCRFTPVKTLSTS